MAEHASTQGALRVGTSVSERGILSDITGVGGRHRALPTLQLWRLLVAADGAARAFRWWWMGGVSLGVDARAVGGLWADGGTCGGRAREIGTVAEIA